MKINCSYTELIEPHKLVPHPQNPNIHPEQQIERLAKIIDYQGQRSPIVVCKDTGFVIVGHGRLEAMVKLGYGKVAVDYQSFANDAQRYAHMTADNAIGEWSSLDLGKINIDFTNLGPELDLELLGLPNFEIDPAVNEDFEDEPLTDSQMDKLEKYLDKDFIEVKLFYNKDEYDQFTLNCQKVFDIYNTDNISDVFLRMLNEKVGD